MQLIAKFDDVAKSKANALAGSGLGSCCVHRATRLRPSPEPAGDRTRDGGGGAARTRDRGWKSINCCGLARLHPRILRLTRTTTQAAPRGLREQHCGGAELRPTRCPAAPPRLQVSGRRRPGGVDGVSESPDPDPERQQELFSRLGRDAPSSGPAVPSVIRCPSHLRRSATRRRVPPQARVWPLRRGDARQGRTSPPTDKAGLSSTPRAHRLAGRSVPAAVRPAVPSGP